MQHERKLSAVWRVFVSGLLLLWATDGMAAVSSQERAALIAVYNALGGPNWQGHANWLGDAGTECTWAGVTCDSTASTVTELNVAWNNARGTLPREIGDLSNLVNFQADGSAISGPLPPEIGRLSKLQVLNLTGYYGDNEISGPIPREIGQMTSLRELYLPANEITAVPDEIAQLPNLEVLDLSYNPMSGPLPAGLFRMPKLRILHMERVQMTGSIPSQLSLPALTELVLGENQLTGSIPDSLGQSTRLTLIDLNSNNLTGPIPASFNQLTNLTSLHLNSNQLSGPLPDLSGLTRLTELVIYRNNLSGPIPAWIGGLRELNRFWIGGNGFSGALPAEFFTLPKIDSVDISDNQLTGNLADFGKLATVTQLTLGGSNDFHGPFPLELTHLEKLTYLDLTAIPLGGSLPPDIRLLKNLTNLYLDRTGIGGAIPEEFGELTELTSLSLRGNLLTKLPASFARLTKLTALALSSNQLSGPIPSDTFGGMTKLAYLDLGSNQFSGPIPPDLFALTELRQLYLGGNSLTGTVPGVGRAAKLGTLDLSDNQLSGLPDDLGSLTNLGELFLGSNQFTGPPPAAIRSLTNLTSLKLEVNHFSGPIPDWSPLTRLNTLFLYANQFSGPIPSWIGTLSGLSSVILSENKLSGRVPANITSLTNLSSNYGIRIGGNALYTDDPTVRAFLDRYDNGWDGTQTVAPGDVRVTAQREHSITLSWTPIAFSSGPGGYQIAAATSAAGPFNVLTTTPDKKTSTFIVDGLDRSTSYFFTVSAVSYPNESQQNVVTSDPTPPIASATTTGTPAPPSVVVFVYPYEIRQRPGEGGGTTTYVIGNVGDLPSNVTLSAAGDLFTQDPASFTLPGGSTQVITVTGKAQAAGAFTGAAQISGDGVPAGLAVRISLLVTAPPDGIVNALPSANRIDVAAKITSGATGSVDFTNTGSATLQGIVTSNVAWIIPPSDLIVIAPGATRTVTFTVDQTKRPDASSPAGAVTGTLSLVYESSAAGKTVANGVTVPKTTPVTVVYTITPPVDAVTIPPLAGGEVALFVVGAGNVAGAKGTYISDLSIANVFGVESPNDIRMYYSPSDASLGTQVTQVQQLEPSKGITFADVVKSVFDKPSLGTIQIRTRSLDQIFVNANIFNVTDRNGTYGTALPIFRSDRALRPGESLFLTGLRREPDKSFYTNLFIQETAGVAATYSIEYFDVAGKTVGDKVSGGVNPFRLALLGDAVPAGAVAARISNAADSGGRIIAYATPIDSTSGDFWAVADWNHELGAALNEPVIVPVAGSVHGRLNAFFRTDLAVTNRSAASGGGTLKFFDRSGPTATRELVLGAGASLMIGDVLGSSFPQLSEPLGYLEFDPADQGSFSLSSRTFATQPNIAGTFGTGVPVLPKSAALRLGQSKIITGLDVASPQTTNAGTPGTFRTNVQMIEIDGKPVTVEVTVIYNDIKQLVAGIRLTTLHYDLAPHGSLNKSLAEEIRASNPNVSDLRSVQLKFRVVAGDGAVIAFTSSVDNGTQDQVLRVQ